MNKFLSPIFISLQNPKEGNRAIAGAEQKSSASFQQILDKLLLKNSLLGQLSENNVGADNNEDVLVNGISEFMKEIPELQPMPLQLPVIEGLLKNSDDVEKDVPTSSVDGSVDIKNIRLQSPLSSTTYFLELVPLKNSPPLNDTPSQVQIALLVIRMADLLKNVGSNASSSPVDVSEGKQDIRSQLSLSMKPDTTHFLGWITIKNSSSETTLVPVLVRMQGLLKNTEDLKKTVAPSPVDVPVKTKEIQLPPTHFSGSNKKPKNLELVPEFDKVIKSNGDNNPGEKTIKIFSQHSDNINGKAVQVLQDRLFFSEIFFDKKVFTLSSVSPSSQNFSQSQSVINQIVTRVIIMMRDERSEINMQLKPEQLGGIKIKLVVEDMAVAAKLQVENPDVKTILESHLPELKKALAEYGLRIEKFEVFVKQEFSQHQNQTWQDKRRPKDKTLMVNRAEEDIVNPVLTPFTRPLGYNTIEIVA